MKKRSSRLAYWQGNDTAAEEATPEELRIEIENIFREFFYSDEKEYTFSPNLNNLQRKYIHEKAKMMNLTSKSRGKEPNRTLTISKKTNTCKSETCSVLLGNQSMQELYEILDHHHLGDFQRPYKRKMPHEKVFGKLFSSLPVDVPAANVPHDMATFKRSLPITSLKRSILEEINQNQVIIISSETGSGKTTQIPQFILEECHERRQPCRIICTQPRRISTVAVAERVSKERGDSLGNSVGYHIRLESRLSLKTNLIYCTNGVLVRSLMSSDSLSYITHVIIDEVHERDRLSDFLLICLKKALPENPNLKLILMSATVNIDKFKTYFPSTRVVNVPGRLYDIQEFFLDEILYETKYMSLKMQQIQKESTEATETETGKIEKSVEMDVAINECLRKNSMDAWAQLLVYILSENMSVNYRHSQTGLTPLMVAAINNSMEHIGMLRQCNADLNIRCFRGRTALDWALHHENHTAVDFLTQSYVTQMSREQLLECYIKSVTDDLLDFELLAHVISFIHRNLKSGAILVFLPGYDDIMILSEHLNETLKGHAPYQLFYLHGSMNIGDQHAVFNSLPNKRKIILSTNIAETSITINDVVYVMDSGKAKEKTFDSYSGFCSLQTKWISKACVKQRAGRAGRTNEGFCFHIFSHQRYRHFQEERTPEILRVPLEALCLNTKVIAPSTSLAEFFAMAPDPPSVNLVRAAIESLVSLGAMDTDEKLTALGEYLGELTIDPHLGKMLVFSVIFRCLDPVLTLVAVLAQKDPFQLPMQMRQKAEATSKRKSLNQGVPSDHLIYIRAYQLWQEYVENFKETDFLREYFISKSTMDSALMVRSHLMGQLRGAGFVAQRGPQCIQDLNVNSGNWALVKAIIASGLYPRIGYFKGQTLRTKLEKSVGINTTSSVHHSQIMPHLWVMFDEINRVRTTSTIKGVTVITPVSVALMCGNHSESNALGEMTIDGWLEFQCHHGVFFIRKCLELVINKMLASSDNYLQPHEQLVIDTVAKILMLEDKQHLLPQPSDLGQRPKFLERIPPRNNYRRQQRPYHNHNHNQRGYGVSSEGGEVYGGSPRYETSSNGRYGRGGSGGGGGNANDHMGLHNGALVNGHVSSPLLTSPRESPSLDNAQPFSLFENNTTVGCGRYNGRAIYKTERDTFNNMHYKNSSRRNNYNNDMRTNQQHTAAAAAASLVDPQEQYPASSSGSNDFLSALTNSLSLNNQPSNVYPTAGGGAMLLSNGYVGDELGGGAQRLLPQQLGDAAEEYVYLLIKPHHAHSVSIAYETSKWVFSPQTERKILQLVNQQKAVKLIYTANDSKCLLGIAEFLGMQPRNGKPEARINWLHKFEVPYALLRGRISNAELFQYKTIDGQDISLEVGDALVSLVQNCRM